MALTWAFRFKMLQYRRIRAEQAVAADSRSAALHASG
jgi:hypothetical protein